MPFHRPGYETFKTRTFERPVFDWFENGLTTTIEEVLEQVLSSSSSSTSSNSVSFKETLYTTLLVVA